MTTAAENIKTIKQRLDEALNSSSKISLYEAASIQEKTNVRKLFDAIRQHSKIILDKILELFKTNESIIKEGVGRNISKWLIAAVPKVIIEAIALIINTVAIPTVAVYATGKALPPLIVGILAGAGAVSLGQLVTPTVVTSVAQGLVPIFAGLGILGCVAVAFFSMLLAGAIIGDTLGKFMFNFTEQFRELRQHLYDNIDVWVGNAIDKTLGKVKVTEARLYEASISEMAEVIHAFTSHKWFQINSKDTKYGHYCFRKNDTYAYVNEEALHVTYIDAMTDEIIDEHPFGSIEELINSIE